MKRKRLNRDLKWGVEGFPYLEGEAIINELCSDVLATEAFCSKILSYINEKIMKDEKM